MKLYLVNKNPMIAKLVKLSADKAGIEYIESSSIKSDFKADVMLVDDECYDKELLREYRQDHVNIKVGLLYAKSGERIEGFEEYIQKPFLPTDLFEILVRMGSAMPFKQEDLEQEDIQKDQTNEENEESLELAKTGEEDESFEDKVLEADNFNDFESDFADVEDILEDNQSKSSQILDSGEIDEIKGFFEDEKFLHEENLEDESKEQDNIDKEELDTKEEDSFKEDDFNIEDTKDIESMKDDKELSDSDNEELKNEAEVLKEGEEGEELFEDSSLEKNNKTSLEEEDFYEDLTADKDLESQKELEGDSLEELEFLKESDSPLVKDEDLDFKEGLNEELETLEDDKEIKESDEIEDEIEIDEELENLKGGEKELLEESAGKDLIDISHDDKDSGAEEINIEDVLELDSKKHVDSEKEPKADIKNTQNVSGLEDDFLTLDIEGISEALGEPISKEAKTPVITQAKENPSSKDIQANSLEELLVALQTLQTQNLKEFLSGATINISIQFPKKDN